MDNFIDKLAQRFTAGEVIRANSAAEERELKKLREQVAEYERCLQEMRKIQMTNTQSAQQLHDLMVESSESIHKLVKESLDKVAAISDKKYLKMFDRMLTQKYGDHVPGETNEKRKKAEEKMLQRKNNLQAEYEQFLGGLLRRRAQTNALKKHEDLLGSDGRFIGFRNAAADRVQE